MLSFRQYILCEDAESPQPFHHIQTSSNSHVYRFHLGDDTEGFKVKMLHNDSGTAHVNFEDPHGGYRRTGEYGTRSAKVLSTVHRIMKHHAAAYPNVKEFIFSSDNDEPSRVKLYSRYTLKHGGKNVHTGFDTYHTVPTKNLA